MNIGTLVSGLALGYALAMPAYASSPRDQSALEFPSFTGEEERALGLETLAGLIITRMPHPQVAYVCRSNTSSELCVAQLTFLQGNYVVAVKSTLTDGYNSQLSLFHTGKDKKPLPQNLVGIYDFNSEKLIRGNLHEFDVHLGIILDMYTSQLMLPEECTPIDI